MESLRKLLATTAIALILSACGSVDDNAKVSVGTKDFAFTPLTSIALPLTEEQSFILTESVNTPHEETYVIEDSIDLDALNATLTDNEKLAYSDLDIYTYFLIRNLSCNEYYEFSNASYTDPTLTITLEHFVVNNDTACIALSTEPYLVFKAAKSP